MTRTGTRTGTDERDGPHETRDEPRGGPRDEARDEARGHAHGFPVPPSPATLTAARNALDARPLVLVGLMGAGKTTVGRQVAQLLERPFVDADEAIEEASRMSVADLFSSYGEPEFRSLERRVIERLMGDGAIVLATGGGAFMDAGTRALIARGATSVWLRADLDVLVERTAKRNHRPLLRTGDPRTILSRLMDERHPTYGQADLAVESTRQRREVVASRVVHAVAGIDVGAPADAGSRP